MAVNFSQLIAQMDAAYPGVYVASDEAQSAVATAWVRWGEANYESCLYWTLFAVDKLDTTPEDIVGYFIWGANGFDSMIPLAFKYLKNAIDDIVTEVTMDGILSAMLGANPDQVEYFVGLVDAYRQSIWNRPFNKDFYAALARGFMQWP